jgi:hypothetical protein
MGKVKLIGVIHDDLSVQRRTKLALDTEKPQRLAVELTEDDVLYMQHGFREHIEQVIQKHAKKSTDAATLESIRQIYSARGGEIFAAMEYASAYNIPLLAIDNAKPPLRTEEVEEGTSVENLSLADGIQRIEQGYAQFQEIFDNPDRDFETEIAGLDADSARDEIPAARLAMLTEETNGDIVYVCGLYHMMDDHQERTVYSKLQKRGIPVSRATVRYYDDPEQLRQEGKPWEAYRKLRKL